MFFKSAYFLKRKTFQEVKLGQKVWNFKFQKLGAFSDYESNSLWMNQKCRKAQANYKKWRHQLLLRVGEKVELKTEMLTDSSRPPRSPPPSWAYGWPPFSHHVEGWELIPWRRLNRDGWRNTMHSREWEYHKEHRGIKWEFTYRKVTLSLLPTLGSQNAGW